MGRILSRKFDQSNNVDVSNGLSYDGFAELNRILFWETFKYTTIQYSQFYVPNILVIPVHLTQMRELLVQMR